MKIEFFERYRENYSRLQNREINDEQWRDISLLLLEEIMGDWVEFNREKDIPKYEGNEKIG